MEGGSVTEGSVGMSMSDSSFGRTREEPAKAGGEDIFIRSAIKPPMYIAGVSESGEVGEGVEVTEGVEVRESGEDQVTITLSETETIDLLSIPGTIVLDLGQQEAVQASNQTYQEVRRHGEM